MSFQGLPTQLAQILFGAGLDQKSDVRESSPPSLDICQNVEFDEIANARTRKPFDATQTPLNIVGGGTITAPRDVFDNGGELILFTDTALYSWIPEANAWALRDTHMAVALDEEPVFAINGDQTCVDRAEMSGVVMMAWVTGSQAYIAAYDKVTGAVILAPTDVEPVPGGVDLVHFVPLASKVLLLFRNSGHSALYGLIVDPANVAGSIVSATVITSTLISSGVPLTFDAVKIPNADTALVAVGNSSTQYQLISVTSGLVITRSVKARGANTAIAISVDPAGAQALVARVASTAASTVVGDLLNASTLADVSTAHFMGSGSGTTVTHLTCAHRLVQNSGAYRCYVFWSLDESPLGFTGPTTLKAFQSQTNWMDTSGTIGTQTKFISDLGLASRAFAYGNFVYVWGVFAGVTPLFGSSTFPLSAIQNTCFLYRDDARLVAKCNDNNSGGLIPGGTLPGVQLVSGSTSFAWGSVIRRIVPLNQGNSLGQAAAYTGRAPCSVTFSFDDDRARRCVRLGKTLYITGGQVLQYDGVSLTELGFHIYPWDFIAQGGGAGTLTMATGNYAVKCTYHSTNAVGEVDRSTTATIDLAAATGPTGNIATVVKPLYYTRKTNANIEVWRTKVAPIDESPFYLTTSQDPTVLTGNNYFIPNDTTQTQILYQDYLPDTSSSSASLATQVANPENGTVLESINPPPCTIMVASDTRLFIAGIAGEPNAVMYSKTRNDGEVVSFNDTLTIQVPQDGGPVTGIGFLGQSLVVFCETAIFVYNGDGFDNAAGGSNFTLARYLSTDCGAVNLESIALLDEGLMFKSDKGWYLIGLDFSLRYIGAPVASYDTDDIYAVHVLTAQHQVRIVTDRRILVLDTLVKQWGEWTEFAIGATLWNGVHVLCKTNGVAPQRSDFTGITYGWDLEFAWWKPNDLQGRAQVQYVQLLGEWRGALSIHVRSARNYEVGGGGWNYNQDEVLPVASATPGAPLQFRIAPTLKRGQAFKFRFTALAADGVSAPSGDTAKLSGIAIRYGLEDGLYQGLAAAQRK